MDLNQLNIASDMLGDDVSDAVVAFAALEMSEELCFECGDTFCDCGISIVGEQ